MDFSSHSVATIDFSLHPSVRRTTLVLEEPELASATIPQMERFWRVWYSDRQTSAPNLVEVTLVLRPGLLNGKPETPGIQRFLHYFETCVKPNCGTKRLHIYQDNWTALIGGTRYNIAQDPTKLL
jgi:hypothetical protein